ncbi:M61 family metallopeptidase [Aestuariibacter sp. A3R04]|uniref:M61 family metallopeptidase n=1 Tax=Aestuariibacter sp. A3R04 TaxID=2841571 RepID=UPI001C07EEE8|nr:PDZ domain-containing protein [Aestuariibacter sp. A3R04]MBU3022950.1 PDZ domain-containing protein [Aestuariibacter sp. A3R04]
MTCLHYTLSVQSRADHLFSLRLAIPAGEQQVLTLTLPSWIPGSYMVRDFAKNIITLKVTTVDGETVNVQKLDKQTWQVDARQRALVVDYTVYAFDLSVRAAYLCDEYGFVNGTSVFLSVAELKDSPCKVSISLSDATRDWSIHTSMPTGQGNYYCENYAELIDHPIFMGQCVHDSTTVQGIEFSFVYSGTTPVNTRRICEDMVPICEHHLSLFPGPPPVKRYLFITLLSDTGFGGLEHKHSTALLYPRFDLPLKREGGAKTDQYITFLSLCCHELFHTWHVKRLRPEVMLKPNLAAEVYTRQLWIYEGFTSFYDDVTLARKGLISPEKYLEIVAQNLTRLQVSKGRFKQSVAESSFDAWTKFYKQDASAPNSIVSYYTKGGIIAFGLDLLLRRKSQGKVSLDTLMQQLWRQYGANETGTPDDVIERVCQQSFGIDVSDYLGRVVYGTEDVPLAEWVGDIGISLHTRPKNSLSDRGGQPPTAAYQKHPLGAMVKNADTGVTVQVVFEGGAASAAGLQVNDKIIALNGWVVTDVLLQRLLNQTDASEVELTIVRDGRVLLLHLPVTQEQQDACYFTIEDKAAFSAWLHN